MATQLQEAPEVVPDAVIVAGADEGQTAAERDYEAEARRQGWKPQEEFTEGERPPRGGFKDAEAFIKDAEEKAGLQRQTIARMASEISFLKRQQQRIMQSEQSAYANALEDIKAQMKEAVTIGDIAGFEALDKKADRLRQDMQADDKAQQEDPAEHILAFREENPWYDKGALASASEAEVEARLFADRTADRWIAQGKPQTMKPSQFYAELAEAVNERFPMLKHKAARAKPPSDVAATTRSAPRGNGKTGAALPADAKATAERYMRQKIPGYNSCKSKEEAYNLFAQSYQWEA